MEMKYSKNGIGKTGNFVTRGEETSKLLTAYRLNGEAFNTGFFFKKSTLILNTGFVRNFWV